MGATDRLQQVTGTVEIDPVTLVEVGLRLAGDNRGKVEDHLRPVSHHSVARRWFRQVEHDAVERARPALRRRRLHYVEQAESVQADPAEVAVDNEPIGQLAADHPGSAGHCDTHSDPPLVFGRSLRTRGLPSGKNISQLVTSFTGL
jgi:hypothetical protein